MLTREEAKAKICPCKYETSPSIASGAYTDFNITCVAEECPKWVDTIDKIPKYDEVRHIAWCNNYNGCNKIPKFGPNKDITVNYKTVTSENYMEYCVNCEKRYGRCGG